MLLGILFKAILTTTLEKQTLQKQIILEYVV